MQIRAIFEAAIEVQKEGIKVKPEIMIPLVGFAKELELQVALVRQLAAEISKEHNTRLNYLVGTMIEIPRACVVADEIAKEAEFFSFGTNDLTQTGLGMSRDDSGSFLPAYQSLEILKQNPFATIDRNGVGGLMKLGVTGGRKTRPDIKLGICGRTRRRSGLGQILSRDRPQLRQLLAVPRAHRPSRRRPGRAGRRGVIRKESHNQIFQIRPNYQISFGRVVRPRNLLWLALLKIWLIWMNLGIWFWFPVSENLKVALPPAANHARNERGAHVGHSFLLMYSDDGDSGIKIYLREIGQTPALDP